MATNFTPLNVQKFRGENNSLNTVLLLIVTLTTFILVILLFILIQKKMNAPSTNQQNIMITPSITIITPSPTPTIAVQIPTSGATPSGQIDISPTLSATESPTISP